MRVTHTYAILEVSEEAYDAIAARLKELDYGHVFHSTDDHGCVIDMHGIALARGEPTTVPPLVMTVPKDFDIEAFKREIRRPSSMGCSVVEPAPVDMVLHCPSCGIIHIDEPHGDWTNPPHRTHQCQHCKTEWRPAHVATNGVAALPPKEPPKASEIGETAQHCAICNEHHHPMLHMFD